MQYDRCYGMGVVKRFTYKIEEADDFLKIVSSGSPSTTQEMMAYVNHLVKEMKESDCSRILVDETLASIRLEHHEAVSEADLDFFAEIDGMDVRVAIVCASHSLELYKFVEAAFESRSFRLKVFDDLKEGQEWLNSF